MSSIRILTVFVLSMCVVACGEPRRSYHGGESGMTVTDPPDVHLSGDRITIDDHIRFALDSDEILSESDQLLDHIAQFLGNHPEITSLSLVGHTDESGGHEHNQDLSQRRAAAVQAALEQRGVRQPIDSRGAGETEPLCDEDTDACHAQNRRVEFLVQLQ